jgi:hypothetical protein
MKSREVYPSMYQLSITSTQDSESVTALQEYMAALSHPRTGIPCQELMSGIKIFTGSSAVHWFFQNMEGVSSIQNAQVVGQRLIDLGLFIEIQGGTHFIVSNTVHYQFCSPTHPKTSTMDVREVKRSKIPRSLGSLSYSSRQLQDTPGVSRSTIPGSLGSLFCSSKQLQDTSGVPRFIISLLCCRWCLSGALFAVGY